MKAQKHLQLGLMLMLGCFAVAAAQAYPLRNEPGQTVKQIQVKDFFYGAKQLPATQIQTDPLKLAAVARETLAYLNRHPNDPASKAGVLQEMGVSLEEVKATLQKIIQTVEEDQQAKRPQRLNDPKWIEKNFQLIAWKADTRSAAEHNVKMLDQRLRITKYVVFEGQGSPVQTSSHCCALYALPPDEASLSAEAAEAQKAKLIRYRYTKQQVVGGALAAHKVQPLVWLTRQGLEDALMQGSIMVRMPNGSQRMFNVHRNNGIAYDRNLKDPKQQKRYWYFKEVKGILGYGHDDKIVVQPEVTFAGDVYNLGLGKVIAISYLQQGKPVVRLGVLADTGGAFIPNLYQLDYLAGVFPNRTAYQKGVAALPEYAQTFILLSK